MNRFVVSEKKYLVLTTENILARGDLNAGSFFHYHFVIDSYLEVFYSRLDSPSWPALWAPHLTSWPPVSAP